MYYSAAAAMLAFLLLVTVIQVFPEKLQDGIGNDVPAEGREAWAASLKRRTVTRRHAYGDTFRSRLSEIDNHDDDNDDDEEEKKKQKGATKKKLFRMAGDMPAVSTMETEKLKEELESANRKGQMGSARGSVNPKPKKHGPAKPNRHPMSLAPKRKKAGRIKYRQGVKPLTSIKSGKTGTNKLHRHTKRLGHEAAKTATKPRRHNKLFGHKTRKTPTKPRRHKTAGHERKETHTKSRRHNKFRVKSRSKKKPNRRTKPSKSKGQSFFNSLSNSGSKIVLNKPANSDSNKPSKSSSVSSPSTANQRSNSGSNPISNSSPGTGPKYPPNSLSNSSSSLVPNASKTPSNPSSGTDTNIPSNPNSFSTSVAPSNPGSTSNLTVPSNPTSNTGINIPSNPVFTSTSSVLSNPSSISTSTVPSSPQSSSVSKSPFNHRCDIPSAGPSITISTLPPTVDTNPPSTTSKRPTTASSPIQIKTSSKGSMKQMLRTLIQDVEELKRGSFRPADEDKPCRINGTWKSDSLEFLLDLVKWNGSLQVHVRHGNLNFTLSGWRASGAVSEHASGPFLITARHWSGKMLSFAGHCRVCDATDRLIGVWTVANKADDCESAFSHVLTIQDVLSRSYNYH